MKSYNEILKHVNKINNHQKHHFLHNNIYHHVCHYKKIMFYLILI